MKKSNVCAVVATYNRKNKIEKCLNDILAQQGAACDIIVIDNGSSDGTETLIKSKYVKYIVYYYNTGTNLGSAGAQAIGIKEAVVRGYEFVWLMDDDVFPHKDTLAELLKADQELEGRWGILSSVAYWTDGSICEANRQKKTLFSFVNPADYKKKYIKVIMVSAASMFIKSDAVREVGLPISDYFIYTDDYEFSSRVAKKYPMYVVTASRVTHAMNVNMKVNLVKDTPDRMYRYKYLYRNDVHCYRQFGIYGFFYLIFKFLYTFMVVILKEKDQKKEKIRILVEGYKAGIQFEPIICKVQDETC